ncbi:SusC/RagA family TonB-linked outer membrane protein [Flavobacterium psychrotrophum]|uniref:SusC/RagA family TonB-linked outer membrane protein n=1 Tax=Flavobacterium psychrotrophum TaxID=2294119 RepID=UPI000E32217D|nr:SusC/RagA family TonB-linked outer membrane protein [Flavobacterium psychrotrophum]
MNYFLFCKGRMAFGYPILIGCCLLLCPAPANASYSAGYSGHTWQQHTISGNLRDASGPLPGVSISVKGKNMHAVSTADGTYSINAGLQDILVFESIGYKTVEISVDGRTTIDLVLEEDSATLEEVTINAGYYSVKQKESTGSIARITSRDIETQPVTNVLATLQGRMAGVNVVQTTGTPGGGFDIQIRGLNSLRSGGNSPLYIIDGVPYSSEPIGSASTATVLPTQPSPLNSINPEQIASIEVLKDADATAIYGSRGANGVVLITTKKGKVGKMKFTGTMYQGAGTITRKMDLMDTRQYLEMRREALANDGITEYPAAAYDVNGTWDQSRYTDWQEELLGGTAAITNAQVALSGGSGQTQFLLSGTFNRQATVFPSDFNYKKGNVYLNLNHVSDNKRFKVNFSAGYTAQYNNQPRIDLMQEALSLAPNAPALYDQQGKLNWENSTFNNPLRNLEGSYESRTYDLIANAQLSYDLGSGLELKSSFGYSSVNNGEDNASPSTQYDPAYGLGSDFSTLIRSSSDRKSWIIEPQLHWTKTMGALNLDALAGSTFQSQQGQQNVLYASGFSSNSLIYNLAAASQLFVLQDQGTEYRYMAFFSRVNANWKGRYLLNLTGRRDGSSRFGPGKRFASFGAVGAAWIFSEEGFFDKDSFWSFGKLRGSYGITGNDQIGDYQFLDTYSTSGVSYGGVIGLQPSRLYNPEFGWETSKKLEAALEAGFFNDRLFLTLGWYRNRSSSQLTGIPLPGTTGFSSVQANLDATVQNTGVEVTLRSVNFDTKDFNWTTSFNISAGRNKLLAFPGLGGSTYANQYVIGQPLNIRKVYHVVGVDPQTGIYRFEDANGDGTVSSADRQTVKDLNPEYFGGLQNSIRFRRWQLDFLFQFSKQQNFNEVAFFGVPGTASNQPASMLDRWQQPGATATHQLYTDGTNSAAVDAYYRYMESDAAISDASYIRLKNLSLSYQLPLDGISCKIFAQAQNLLTFTSYKGADPEFRATGFLPPLRVISAGIQCTF